MFKKLHLGDYEWINYVEADKIVTEFGSGLMQLGLKEKDTVSIYGETRQVLKDKKYYNKTVLKTGMVTRSAKSVQSEPDRVNPVHQPRGGGHLPRHPRDGGECGDNYPHPTGQAARDPVCWEVSSGEACCVHGGLSLLLSSGG